MTRRPQQVHIFLFRKRHETYEYALFQRADTPFCWQGVCGGLEDSETLEEGARREIFEEAGIDTYAPLYPLESISYLPDYLFSETDRAFWGKDIAVIPMYFFAMPWQGAIQLSEEHTDYKWLSYQQAYELMCFQDQQIALYELNQKLLRHILLPNQLSPHPLGNTPNSTPS